MQRVVARGPAGPDVALALDAPLVGASSNGSDSGLSPWSEQAVGESGAELLPVTGDAIDVV